MKDGIHPKTVFFLTIDTDLLGDLDFDTFSPDGFPTLEAAIDGAKIQADEHNAEQFIFECRPVRRVYRGPVRVVTVKAKRS